MLREKQEERERQDRMMQIMSQNPMMAYKDMPKDMQKDMMSMYAQQGGGQRRGPPPADQSGNPYAPRDR